MDDGSVEIQRVYLKQIIQRYHKDIYDRYSLVFTNSEWEPLDHVYHETNKVKCDFVKPNGNRCGHLIKNEHIFKNKYTEELMGLGIVCVSKMLGITELTGKEKKNIENELTELRSYEEILENIIENKEYMSPIARNEKYTAEERGIIIERAKKLNVYPLDLKKLEEAGIPLTDQQLSYLEKNSINVISRQKEIEKMNKENEVKKYRVIQEPISHNDYQHVYKSRHESENGKDSKVIKQSLKQVQADYDKRVASIEKFEKYPYYIDIDSGEIDTILKEFTEIIDLVLSRQKSQKDFSHTDIFNSYYEMNSVHATEKETIKSDYFYSVVKYIVGEKMNQYDLRFIYLSLKKEAFIVRMQ